MEPCLINKHNVIMPTTYITIKPTKDHMVVPASSRSFITKCSTDHIVISLL